MPFFQNPFGDEFRGDLVLGDRQYVITFPIKANPGQIGNVMLATAAEPYDFSALSVFTLNYAFDPQFKAYTAINVDVAGAVPAATTASEVAAALNANDLFADNFQAYIQNIYRGGTSTNGPFTVGIRVTRRQQSAIRIYISNSGAETQLLFNANAAVTQMPTFFERHTVANRWTYPDGLANLIQLDPGDPVDAAVITRAGLDPTNELDDWQLLRGRSGLFEFRKVTKDGAGRITEIIEYAAGAVVGDFSKRYAYTYTGAAVTPDQITEEPHTLVAGDLVTPP